MKKILFLLFFLVFTAVAFAVEFDGVHYSTIEEAEAAIKANMEEEDLEPIRIPKSVYKEVEAYINKAESYMEIISDFQLSVETSPVDLYEKDELIKGLEDTSLYLEDMMYELMGVETVDDLQKIVLAARKEIYTHRANLSALYVEYIIKLADLNSEQIRKSVKLARTPIATLQKNCPKYTNNLKKIELYNDAIIGVVDGVKVHLVDESYSLAKRELSKAQASVRNVNKNLKEIYNRCYSQD